MRWWVRVRAWFKRPAKPTARDLWIERTIAIGKAHRLRDNEWTDWAACRVAETRGDEADCPMCNPRRISNG